MRKTPQQNLICSMQWPWLLISTQSPIWVMTKGVVSSFSDGYPRSSSSSNAKQKYTKIFHLEKLPVWSTSYIKMFVSGAAVITDRRTQRLSPCPCSDLGFFSLHQSRVPGELVFSPSHMVSIHKRAKQVLFHKSVRFTRAIQKSVQHEALKIVSA